MLTDSFSWVKPMMSSVTVSQRSMLTFKQQKITACCTVYSAWQLEKRPLMTSLERKALKGGSRLKLATLGHGRPNMSTTGNQKKHLRSFLEATIHLRVRKKTWASANCTNYSLLDLFARLPNLWFAASGQQSATRSGKNTRPSDWERPSSVSGRSLPGMHKKD